MQRNNIAKMSNTYMIRQKLEFKKYTCPHPANWLSPSDRVAIAYALYDAGFEPYWTTDIMDELVVGYGDSPIGPVYELVPVDGCDSSKGIEPWEKVKASLKRLAAQDGDE